MRDFAIIWLLLNTKTGKIILGVIIGLVILSMVGWWMVPIIAALLGVLLIYEYYSCPPDTKEYKNRNKKILIAGISFLIFALLFSGGFYYYKYMKPKVSYRSHYGAPLNTEEEIDNSTIIPDSVITDDIEKDKPVYKRYSSSSSISSSSSSVDDDYDNMRGFDPASEDDMDDNGMSRYMENTDDEGWD